MAIPAASALKFLYLAKELGLDPRIDYTGEEFSIIFSYPDSYRNKRVAIDEKTSESVEDGCYYTSFHTELRYLVDKYNEKQKDSEEEERQEVLNRLTDREKELLGLT